MPDMVFVFPPVPRKNEFTHHLGAAYIRSYLQEHALDTIQVTTSQEMTIPDIVKEILKYNPRVVGFTCYDANYAYVRIIAKMLKKKDAGITVVLGGPTATFSATVIMEHTPEIDVCVRGEGEKTTLEFLKKGNNLESIKGITYRCGNQLISTEERPLLSGGEKGKELDILPSPYLTGVIPPDGKTGILTARGCVYHCTYCNFSAMFSHTIRYHSVDRVIQELKLIHDYWDFTKKDNFMIHDDIFSLNLKRAKMICQKIIDEEIQLPFFVETRADNCDKELIELMKEAGVQQVNFGLESASSTVLKAVKKAPGREKEFLDQIKRCVEWAKEAGITTSVSTIFGLPGEGFKEAKETLDFVKKLKVDEYYHNVLFLCAGTELFGTRKVYGLDVVHSASFLPYMTVYAYDVGKVTPLPHATLCNQLKLWKKTYCDLVSYGSKNKNYKYLVVKEMPDNMETLCRWLQEKCVLHLSVFDFTKSPKEEIAHQRELLLDGGVPVGVYTAVDRKLNCLKLYTQIDLCTPVPVVPFHHYTEGALFTLEQPQDVEMFADFFTNHVKEGILSFRASEIPKILVDACKWGESLCPALSRGVLVVRGGTVLSCCNGECVGKVGDSIQELQQNVRDLIHKKEKERECNNCLVKNECSRCLFPNFPDDEFCELKRRYPGTAVLVTILEWLYRYPGKDGIIMCRVDEKAPPLFYKGALAKGGLPEVRDTVRIVSLDGKAFAFAADELKGFSLEPELAVILEAFQLKTGKEDLVSYLCETGIDREKALKSISDAACVLEVAGFLKTSL